MNQECSGKAVDSIEQLFDDKPRKIILCDSPEEEIVGLLTANLETAEILAEGIASDLYPWHLIPPTLFRGRKNMAGRRGRGVSW